MIYIRPETAEDYAAIYEVNTLAFMGDSEAKLVDRIRLSSGFVPGLSLVALKDNKVAGHILFSLINVRTANGEVPVLCLAPMAVMPEFQRQGIGSLLVRKGLEECRKLGYSVVIVVGHAEFYPRFGFVPAREKGLEVVFDVPDEAFMVCEIIPGSLDKISGIVELPVTFDEVV